MICRYTWTHAKEHGWEPFLVYRIVNDDQIEFYQKSGSFLHHGNWIYEGSISELQPSGLSMTYEDAVSLSKQRWSPRLGVGTRPDLYAAFEVTYVKQLHDRMIRSKL